jgi:hypothetical protein
MPTPAPETIAPLKINLRASDRVRVIVAASIQNELELPCPSHDLLHCPALVYQVQVQWGRAVGESWAHLPQQEDACLHCSENP